jgi:hypothetical protein
MDRKPKGFKGKSCASLAAVLRYRTFTKRAGVANQQPLKLAQHLLN